MPKLALLLIAVCAAACSDAAPAPEPVATVAAVESEPEPSEAPSVVAAALPAVESPPPDAPLAPAAARTPRARARAKPEAPAPPAGVYVPLDVLLRTTAGPPPEKPLDLSELARETAPDAPRAPGVLDPWKDRVRVQRRSDPIGPAGPRQGTHSETEASLRVPVDESVSLEGGVRVDSREEPGLEEPERKSIPRVGVEVRF